MASPIEVSSIRRHLRRVPGARRAASAWRRRNAPSMWKDLINTDRDYWKAAKKRAKGGPRVLIASSMGGYPLGALLESTLAVALTLRGAQVDVMLCDGLLPACQITVIRDVSPQELAGADRPPRCATCHPSGQSVFGPLGLPVRWSRMLLNRGQMHTAQRIAS